MQPRNNGSKHHSMVIPPRTSEGYFKTSNRMFDWHLPRAFRPTHRLVYLSLNRHANNRPGRIVWGISEERLARETGLGRATVQRAIAFLRKIGLLIVKRRGGTRRGDVRLTSVYCITKLGDFDRQQLCDRIVRTSRHGRGREKRAA